jgi:putative oxidoreductase
VYPEYWREHLPWSAMLLFVVVRGPGAWSLDALIAKHFGKGA